MRQYSGLAAIGTPAECCTENQGKYPYLKTFLVQFDLAYASNRDGLGQSVLDQFLEVVRYQWPNGLIGSFWRWLGGIEAAPQWFQDLMTTAAAAMDDVTYMVDADFQKQLNGGNGFLGYRALLEDGKRVLTVAHSQGNFYANAVYNTLTGENPDWAKRLGITAVATPASYVAGGGPYLTVGEDSIIGSVPLALASTPDTGISPNMVELGGISAWASATIGHNFVKWYLAGTFSRGIIFNNIESMLSSLDASFKHDWEMKKVMNMWGQSLERCLRDDENSSGFSAYIQSSNNRIQISATSLDSADVSIHNTVLPPTASVYALYIVPVPNGVGIFSLSRAITDSINTTDNTEYAGISNAYLTSYTWDKQTGLWSEQLTTIAPLPQFEVDFSFKLGWGLPSTQMVPSSLYWWNNKAYQTGPHRTLLPAFSEHMGSIGTYYLQIISVDHGTLSIDSTYIFDHWAPPTPDWTVANIGLSDRYKVNPALSTPIRQTIGVNGMLIELR